MALTTEFIPLQLTELRREAAFMKADAWRFVQTHAVLTDDGVDLYYTWMKDGEMRNYRISAVQPGQEVPSITDIFLAAFVFENEARELFGVNMVGIAIDFDGKMYDPAEPKPMTFLTPEQQAAREKAKKAAAAKAAKEAAAASQTAAPAAEAAAAEGVVANTPAAESGGRRRFVMTPELQARLDAKMPTLSPEKQAKVKAALEALNTADEQQNTDQKVEGAATPNAVLDPAPAAEPAPAEVALAPEAAQAQEEEPIAARKADEQLEKLISMMGEEDAAKVIAAFAQKEGE